ncbi:hypothetical protein BKA58DRAFT_434251 [Alternaria rosae]|uniref:uncharacterized protein n=1 Tax=Alternaria rosae TaxID=1187941 RepID=UPI001E8D11D6|nr:uncharacterized protein BKA58DRAFT_434251 [Alternaria rosae]KAH6882491.1 hypothetical protein BKA58DRAFT_434251 [Alternaria rosae]
MSRTTSLTNELVYRPARDRQTGYRVNDFEVYADGSMITHWRTCKGKSPNYVHERDVSTVVKISNAINNANAMDQIIWGINHRDDCHPGVESIIGNLALVDLLVVRHFKKWGGLVLSPLRAAQGLQNPHEVVADQQKQRGLTWASGRSLMKYPNWRETHGMTPPPEFPEPIEPLVFAPGPRNESSRGRGGYGGCGGFESGY